ncbi:DUF885 domain-containing protein [Sandarakinorhabdus sp. AAP62]|uniref:DUF885 domain-containing protein n=1 Tax=Sandarakinorhabdus sp. AAP62 TaxID=1248916 RepID=UPI0002FE5BBD|nr:DUF885 domain-containing protein [Sandarakinorhabdus sp. AAP62]
MLNRRTALGLLAAVPATPALAIAESASARFAALIARAAADDAALSPTGPPGQRRPAGEPAFIDPLSDEWAAATLANKRRAAAELAGIDRNALATAERIAHDVFARSLNQAISFHGSGLFAIQRQLALNPSFGLHIEMPDFVAGSGALFETGADYQIGLERLRLFAGHMDMTLVRLREGLAAGHVQPRVLVEKVINQVEALLAQPVDDTAFMSAIRRLPPTLASDRARWATDYRAMVGETVLPAYRRWLVFLRETYLPRTPAGPGRAAIPDGLRLYTAELERHTTLPMAAADIHALGLGEVGRIRAEFEKTRAELGFAGDLKALFEHVRTSPQFYCKTQEELIGRFTEIESRIWPAIPRLFHCRPKAPFKVAPLPALGDQRGTGYYRAGPPDGVSPGILFFNMAMLDTRPIPTLETLTLHEGIPGHHFQVTLVNEDPVLPAFLKRGGSTAYTEGWGLYAESLGRELGMFTDPWAWFGHLDMEMLRAVRLVVDTGLHALGWSRDRAIGYMLDNTSMAPRDVAVEIDRYIAQPGQACAYKIGELSFARLRREAQAALGGKFDVRDFHEVCLNTGALPLAVLDAKVKDWIARGGGRQS